jgi:hypothetical protein
VPGELRVDPQVVHGCGQAMAALAAGLPPAPVGFSEVQAGDPLSNLKSELMFDAALDADLSLSKTDVAVTTWMGYDRPMDLLQAASPDRAINGGAALATYLDGMHASHVGPAAIDTVIGHSYGSTLVGGAATGGNHLAADNVIAVGSSGMLAQYASDLSLETGAHSSPAARKTTLSVW